METLSQLKRQMQSLQRRVGALARALNEYERVRKTKANPFDLAQRLQRILQQAHKVPLPQELQEALDRWANAEQQMLMEQRRGYQLHFVQELERHLQALGLKLEGHIPRLYAGLYQIQPSFEQGKVRVSWGPEPIATLKGMDAARVAKAVQDHEKSLNRPFVAQEFFALLVQAYRRARQEAGLLDRRVPLSAVHRHLTLLMQPRTFWQNPVRARFREYPRTHFAYDLYRLRQSSLGPRIRLHVATFDQTRDPSQALFVPDSAHRGTRYAYLSIEENHAQQT